MQDFAVWVKKFYEAIAGVLRARWVYIDTVIPYRNTAAVAEIRRTCQLLEEDYEEEGIHVIAYAPQELANRIGLRRT